MTGLVCRADELPYHRSDPLILKSEVSTKGGTNISGTVQKVDDLNSAIKRPIED